MALPDTLNSRYGRHEGETAGHNVVAAYGGDTNYAVSDSNFVIVNYSKAQTVTTLSTAQGTLSATVGRVTPGAGVPGGVVAFYDNGKLVGSVLLVNGQASLGQVGTAAGHSYTASYIGDSGFAASASSPKSIPTGPLVHIGGGKPSHPAPHVTGHHPSRPMSRFGF